MDDVDADQSQFMTPNLTPINSDAMIPPHYSDAERSFLPITHQPDLAGLLPHLEQNLNDNYPSSNNNYEGENESDAHEQQPTEATDDSNLPQQLHKDPVEKNIEKSLHPQASQERDDIRSPVHEIEQCNETFSSAVEDLENVYETKPSEPAILVCKESLCIPYTDEQDEISLIKQTLTTTTTITTEYTEPKKDKNDVGHIMISYNHSTKPLCSKIARALKNLNYIVWIDQDNISGDILTSMASAVENAFVVLMAINEQYYQSRYCRLEAEYSIERNKASIPMLMQSGYKALGWLGIINGSKLHIDFSALAFEEAFNLLIREIESIRISLGADGHDRTVSTYMSNTQSMTTMNNSWVHFQNVHEWNADDVTEWLSREKLEIFETTLTNFSGATLWQLYKIKFDSATDYYRMVDSLLPPTIPLRLFYNLTFNAALESLFSSSNHKNN